VAASHVLEQWRHFQHANVINLLDLILSADSDDSNCTCATYQHSDGTFLIVTVVAPVGRHSGLRGLRVHGRS
jgi:hypothetical protein